MDKEYYSSINEVSKRLSVPAYTLRYWEKQFPVVIRPTTGAGGRRYYRADTVERLTVIRDLLYKHGMTIAGVKKLLRSGNFPASASRRWIRKMQPKRPQPPCRRMCPRRLIMYKSGLQSIYCRAHVIY